MKRYTILLSFLLPLILFKLSAQSIQDYKATLKKSELIMQSPPFESCHASTIVELKNNKFMAAWFGGMAEGKPDVSIWISTLDNGKWNEPVKIADGIINDSLRYPCWNPVLFKTREGVLFLFYKVGKSPREWWGMVTSSTNDGKTWSAKEKLPDGMLGPIKNKPVQLQNGDILYPTSTESMNAKIWNVHMERSDAKAKNWKNIPLDNDTFGAIQPSILTYPGKRMQILCRSRQNYILEAWSNDNGNSWTALRKTELPNPNSGSDAVTLKNNVQVLVYNPLKRGREWDNGRQKLNVAISINGKEWKDIYELENKERGGYSYPAVIQDSRGLVHITYTSDRKDIRHVVLDIKK